MNDQLEAFVKAAVASGRVPSYILEASSSGRLHKLAANMINEREGSSLPELDIAVALKDLGKNIYVKRAEWGMVQQGLRALASLREDD